MPKSSNRHKKLTTKQEIFCREYMVDLNATQAAIRAGYSEKSAKRIAVELLNKTHLADHIQELKKEREEKLGITAEMVLTELWNIATADRRELVEVRRVCCRYCYGKDFRYQRTQGEFERAIEAHNKTEQAWVDADDKYVPKEFDTAGGIGYDPHKGPHSECPECFGEGIEQVFIHDTRSFSPAAATIFAGARRGKDGIEIKTNDKEKALELIGRHLGMFPNKTELTGADGKDLIPESPAYTDPLEAQRAYIAIMQGKTAKDDT